MLWYFRYVTMLQHVWTNHVQVLRGRVRRDLKNSEKTWKIMNEWNANCWSSAARSLLWWSVSRGCNDATSASSSSKNLVMPSVRTSPLDTDNPRRGSREQSRNWSDIGDEYASGEYVSSNEQSLVWREIDAAFENRILTDAVINSNHIEPHRFLEDAAVLQRVRDAVERYGSVKVNTAFNGEFATKDKRANKSILIKNSEIYQYIDLREWYKQHVVQPILVSLEEFQERDSGWTLLRTSNLTINVNKLKKSSARGMSHRSASRNSETSGN